MEKVVPVGSEGSVVVGCSQGFLTFSLTHKHASGEVTVQVKESADYFLDKLAALIPGVWDDAILAIMKDTLKKLP